MVLRPRGNIRLKGDGDMGLIIDHNLQSYRDRWEGAGQNKWNGAFFYSKEIVDNIIPRVKTNRNWVTINQPGACYDHAVVFIHNNKHPERYEWLKGYKDLVLVCGVPQTVEKVKGYAKHVIYLPLSIDVQDVMQYERPKTKEAAFVGRAVKMAGCDLPLGCAVLADLPRTKLLPAMAEYKTVYAVGRCAIEARALGCEIGAYDPRYPDPSIWRVVDNSEAAEMLQKELNKIDKGGL